MKSINHESELNLGVSKYIAIKFGSENCGPCKKLQPNLLKMAEEFQDILFIDIDIETIPQLAKQYRIQSMPTVVLLKNGREIDRIVGNVLIDSLRSKFRNLIKGKYNTADNYISAAE